MNTRLALATLSFFIFTTACGGCTEDEANAPEPISSEALAIAKITTVSSHKFMGDLWTNVWLKDGTTLWAWGDGTGMAACIPANADGPATHDPVTAKEVSAGCYQVIDRPKPHEFWDTFCKLNDCNSCYPLCEYVPNGALQLTGAVDKLECPGGKCVWQRNFPSGKLTSERSDKTASFVAVGDRLLMTGYYPTVKPTHGYVAYRDGNGDWTEVTPTVWKDDSPFKVVLFFQMGKGYAANTDGYLYGLGQSHELREDGIMKPHLLRVPIDKAIKYEAYEYFSGTATQPAWSSDLKQAAALEGIWSHARGSVIYHEGTGRYLFFSGLDNLESQQSRLFEAPKPWGPWRSVGTFEGGFIPSLIGKDAGPKHIYFTKAGGSTGYNLNVARIDFE